MFQKDRLSRSKSVFRKRQIISDHGLITGIANWW